MEGSASYRAMRWLYHPLLMLLANSTDSELARQVEYLKAENTILRKRLPKRLVLASDEKRLLVRLGQAVGAGIQALLTVVSYPTFRRWVNLLDPPPPGTHPNRPQTKPGRPRTPDGVRELVLRLARENASWGYTRILGELKKLGIRTSRSNVVNIMRCERLDPKTDPTKGTWGNFLKAHAHSLWQCDFFSKHLVTAEGVRQCFVLAFVHVATRRVHLSSCSFKPDAAWMVDQAEAFVAHAREAGLPSDIVLMDNDSKFVAGFSGVLEAEGLRVMRTSLRAPNMNAYAERFIQSVEQDCLDQLIVFGREHLDCVLGEYVEHYHHERPHQSLGNSPPLTPSSAPRADQPESTAQESIVCRERLGGLLRHYERAA